jgi:hypothetical protein
MPSSGTRNAWIESFSTNDPATDGQDYAPDTRRMKVERAMELAMFRTKHFFITLASLAAVSAAYLLYIRFMGAPPRLLDHIGAVATMCVFLVATTFPPLLLVDRLVRNVPRTYRTWVWLALAIISVSSVWLATFALLRRFTGLGESSSAL